MSAIDDALLNATLNNAYNVFAQNRPRALKRLNAYDTELFEEIPVTKINTDINFNGKTKIQELDNELKNIDEKIKFAQIRKDEIAVKDLHIERYKIIQQIEYLKSAAPKSLNLDTPYGHLVAFIAGLAKNVKKKQSKIDKFVQEKVMNKLLSPFSRSQNLKEILNKLNTLNQNVSELSCLRIPYGEQEAKYEELAKYISQATSIQALIKKEIKH